MVGDGINDSPALSAADVGIAISDGSELAREIADITVGADSLQELVYLRRLSKEMMRRIHVNYRAILGINGSLIAAGVTGLIQPTTSALLHNTTTLALSLRSMSWKVPGEAGQEYKERRQRMKKAIIAMSGGVDSSVAAWLMKRDGYDCMGVTMRLFAGEDSCERKGHTCCSLDDVEDARSVARQLGIPYFVFNFTEDFGTQIMDRFVCAYENGFTPNPCIDCNRYMKFEKLMKRAKELDYDYVVTGHYARIEEQDGKFLLKKAIDEKKDQSYVLYSLTQEQLAHTLFPLGGMTKPQIREMAEEQGLINARKHDSQDICFVPDGDYAGFIERYTGRNFEPGNFVDQEGHVLGQHKGIICYTIGQRKGLGLALQEPMYVCRIDPKTNTVVLGRDRDLWSKELTAKDFHWISGEVPTGTQRIKAKIRYRHQEQWANAEITGPDSIHLVFDEPQRAITCGQSVVLYDGDVVVGGGTINGLCGSGSGMESGV